jgi:hypothetical protein
LGKCGPKTRAPAGFSPSIAARSVGALSMRAPAKSGTSDVATGATNPFEIARDSRVGTEYGFFSGSAYTPPLVVLRKNRLIVYSGRLANIEHETQKKPICLVGRALHALPFPLPRPPYACINALAAQPVRGMLQSRPVHLAFFMGGQVVSRWPRPHLVHRTTWARAWRCGCVFGAAGALQQRCAGAPPPTPVTWPLTWHGVSWKGEACLVERFG